MSYRKNGRNKEVFIIFYKYIHTSVKFWQKFYEIVEYKDLYRNEDDL